MIVRCIRCNTEFDSDHSHTHVCPNCRFVFDAHSKQEEFKIIRSSDLVRQTGHRLQEEAGDKCAFHYDADAIGHCKCCGKPLCYACAIKAEQGLLCEPCETGLQAPPKAEPAAEVPAAQAKQPEEAEKPKRQTVSQAMAARPYVAWEYRRQIGRLNALFLTWKQTLFSPRRFFRGVPIGGNYRSPLLYGLFWTLIGSAGGVGWKLLLFIYPTFIEFLGGELVQVSFQLSRTYIFVGVLFLLSPLFALALLLVACTIYHMFVSLFTRQHGGFEATVRVVCYSTGTNVFYFLPVAGVIIGGIWQLVLMTVGLKEVHRTSLSSAIITVLGPFSIFLALGVALMVWSVAGTNLSVEKLLEQLVLFLKA
ncbi:MAG: YIP1 family protein [Candidatus Lindowbacteria bacterium]|nr:YIP1 family protein [Candidatus Lindowbacteria bacterium]